VYVKVLKIMELAHCLRSSPWMDFTKVGKLGRLVGIIKCADFLEIDSNVLFPHRVIIRFLGSTP